MSQPEKVIVHPLVLLSVVDHYNRVAKDTKKRVVGVLLGSKSKGQVDVLNSYAVPFEEDSKSPNIWYFDHNYHENMFAMFKKVNAKEKVIGWYSTGPKIKACDLEINELMRRYTAEPVLCVIDVNPKTDLEIPTKAYMSVENAPELQTKSRRTFSHITCEIGATEAEEVGVEHLLRNIRDINVGTITDQVQSKLASMLSLKTRMLDIYAYLDNVVKGKIPPNHQIIYNLQDILSLCPDLKNEDMTKALATTQNDGMLTIYISSLIRSILALDNLIDNKIKNRAWEREGEETVEDTKAKKEEAREAKEAKDGKDGKKNAKDSKK